MNDVSLLYGKNVCAPPGTVGRPGNTTDDVAVDGRIITAEDDFSAREAGRRLGQLLGGN